MNYWIVSLPRPDMEHCISIGTFGAKRKFVMGQVKPGDKVVCYVTKEFKIIALGEATSEYYLDDAAIFRAAGSFVDRFDFSAERLGSELNFLDYVNKVSFVKNPAYWGVFSKSAIYKISKEDWELFSTGSKSASD